MPQYAENHGESNVQGQATVKNCLVWSYGGDVAAPPNTHYQDTVYRSLAEDEPPPPRHTRPNRKGEVGKPINRGSYDPNAQSVRAVRRSDDGGANEALRGWPSLKNSKLVGRCGHEGVTQDSCLKHVTSDDKQEGKKYEEEGRIDELMANKYQRDDERRRLQNKNELEIRTQGKNKVKVHGNRTAMLRSIANDDKVAMDAKELWKMTKFTKNAKARVTSHRQDVFLPGDGKATSNDLREEADSMRYARFDIVTRPHNASYDGDVYTARPERNDVYEETRLDLNWQD